MIRLDAGPAAATNTMSRLGCLRFCQVIGTGFAQPNMKPAIMYIRPGMRIVPSGSMCLSGFSVSRPSIMAVLSPSCSAIQPCAVSCTVMANRTGNTHATIFWTIEISSIGGL